MHFFSLETLKKLCVLKWQNCLKLFILFVHFFISLGKKSLQTSCKIIGLAPKEINKIGSDVDLFFLIWQWSNLIKLLSAYLGT